MSTSETSSAAGKTTEELCRSVQESIDRIKQRRLAQGEGLIVAAGSIFMNYQDDVIYDLKAQTVVKLLSHDKDFKKAAHEFQECSKQFKQAQEEGTAGFEEEVTYFRKAFDYIRFIAKFLSPYYPTEMHNVRWLLDNAQKDAEFFVNEETRDEKAALTFYKVPWWDVYKAWPQFIWCTIPDELSQYNDVDDE